MIVVAIIGLLAAIALPNFISNRQKGQTKLCIDNLRQIDGAKQEWALENNADPGSTPNVSDVQPYLGRGNGKLPSCPVDPVKTFDTSYVMNGLSVPPTCKAQPTQHVFE